jgi:hypothetical protein
MTTDKDYIMALTGIDETQYNTFYFESAEQFLLSYYSNDQQVVTLLMESSAFWRWWGTQFNTIDEAFALRFATVSAPGNMLQTLWQAAHSPESMQAYPSQHVIEHALSKVWSVVWNEEYVLNHQNQKR